MVEGQRISRQRVQAVADKALMKLRVALTDDPIIRDWMADMGLISRDEV